MINSFGMDAKTVQRKKNYVVYLKEGEQISDMLNIMEAPISMMKFENIRILKEMRNSVNRQVNCETANIHKTVSAAVRQLEDIRYLQKTAREDFCAALPLELRPMSWSVWLRWWPPRLTSLFWTLPMAILPMY